MRRGDHNGVADAATRASSGEAAARPDCCADLATTAVVARSAQQSGRAAASPLEARVAASATPLWSPRRIPAVIYAAAVRQHYPRVIATFAAPGRCVAVDGPTGPLARVAATTQLA